MSPVILVSCVKKKQVYAAQARELYLSEWFKCARSYAESHTNVWYILSAKYGLVSPDTVLEPYELSLHIMKKSERDEWAERVLRSIRALVSPTQLTIFAGELYRAPLVSQLSAYGYTVAVPMQGMGIGQQLHWLKEHV